MLAFTSFKNLCSKASGHLMVVEFYIIVRFSLGHFQYIFKVFGSLFWKYAVIMLRCHGYRVVVVVFSNTFFLPNCYCVIDHMIALPMAKLHGVLHSIAMDHFSWITIFCIDLTSTKVLVEDLIDHMMVHLDAIIALASKTCGKPQRHSISPLL